MADVYRWFFLPNKERYIVSDVNKPRFSMLFSSSRWKNLSRHHVRDYNNSFVLLDFQTTTAQLHGTIGASRSTNFSFKKDFVKDSMVVLGPERTFKLRNPLVHSTSSGLHQLNSGLLKSMDDGTSSLRAVPTSPFNTVQKILSVSWLLLLLYLSKRTCVCFLAIILQPLCLKVNNSISKEVSIRSAFFAPHHTQPSPPWPANGLAQLPRRVCVYERFFIFEKMKEKESYWICVIFSPAMLIWIFFPQHSKRPL